jgi:hypothetical protein
MVVASSPSRDPPNIDRNFRLLIANASACRHRWSGIRAVFTAR